MSKLFSFSDRFCVEKGGSIQPPGRSFGSGGTERVESDDRSSDFEKVFDWSRFGGVTPSSSFRHSRMASISRLIVGWLCLQLFHIFWASSLRVFESHRRNSIYVRWFSVSKCKLEEGFRSIIIDWGGEQDSQLSNGNWVLYCSGLSISSET
jgi:hypothetical protein